MPQQQSGPTLIKGEYKTYTNAQLQEEHSRRRRQLNSLGMGVFSAVAAAPVSGGASLVSLAWPTVRAPYVKKQLTKLEAEMERRHVPKLPLTKRDLVVPLIAGGTSFLIGGMADGAADGISAVTDNTLGSEATAVTNTTTETGLDAVQAGIIESSLNLKDALKDVEGSFDAAVDAYEEEYENLDDHIDNAVDKVEEAAVNPEKVLSSPAFLSGIGQGAFGMVTGELITKGVEETVRPLGGGPSRAPHN